MTRSCKVCRAEFSPQKMGQKVCSPACAITLGPSIRVKALKSAAAKDRRETKQKLEKLKSKAQWAKEAQAAFNAFIRERDADQPCISCGRFHGGQYHAGHYLSVGARPELRFDESNVNKQCAPCNTHLSGNAVLYRKGLIAKLNIGVVEWLEGQHDLRKDTIESLQAIKKHYIEKTKQLKAIQA